MEFLDSEQSDYVTGQVTPGRAGQAASPRRPVCVLGSCSVGLASLHFHQGPGKEALSPLFYT